MKEYARLQIYSGLNTAKWLTEHLRSVLVYIPQIKIQQYLQVNYMNSQHFSSVRSHTLFVF